MSGGSRLSRVRTGGRSGMDAAPVRVIACDVLRPELEWLCRTLSEPPPLTFLEQGLHDAPDTLRRTVQEAVTALEDSLPEYAAPPVILLGYGLCGQGLCGVRARRAELVLPRVHDCIPLLLGVGQARASALSCGGSTFWSSQGWLHCSQLPFLRQREQRRADYALRFGEKNAHWLMEQEQQWLAHYRRVCHIRWPELEAERPCLEEGRRLARQCGLPFATRLGNKEFLRALLNGGRDRRRFLRLAPGQTVALDTDGGLTTA